MAGAEIDDPSFSTPLLAGSFGPTLGALAAGLAEGGLKPWLGRLVRVRAPVWVYVFAVMSLPLLVLPLIAAVEAVPRTSWLAASATLVIAMAPNAVVGGVIFGQGPLGEEPGWRGYLQPRLAGSLVWSSVIVGAIWTLWHAPLMGSEIFRRGLALPAWLPAYALSLVAASTTFALVGRWSAGSVPLAILTHAVMNVTALQVTNFWPSIAAETGFWIIVAALLLQALGALAIETARRRGSKVQPGRPAQAEVRDPSRPNND